MSLDRFEHHDHSQGISDKFSNNIARTALATEELGETCRLFLSTPMHLESLAALHNIRWGYAEAFLGVTAANLELEDAQPSRAGKDVANIRLFSFLTDQRQAVLNQAAHSTSHPEGPGTFLAKHAGKISLRPKSLTRFACFDLPSRFYYHYCQEKAGSCFGEEENALLQRANGVLLAEILNLEVNALERISTERYGSQG